MATEALMVKITEEQKYLSQHNLQKKWISSPENAGRGTLAHQPSLDAAIEYLFLYEGGENIALSLQGSMTDQISDLY